MARWSAHELAKRIGGSLEGDAHAQLVAVTTDSRRSREGAAFFALDGAHFRGGDFVPVAFGAGCSVVVVPRDWSGDVPAGRAAIRHPDPLAALTSFASGVRREWTCPVVAVTGSVGKTTVKEMTAHALAGTWDVLRSPGNYNTIIGLSETILNLEHEPSCAVLEVGASAPFEIARLAEIVRPRVASVTNVSAAHLEGFHDLEGVAREKIALLEAVEANGTRFVDGDDSLVARVVRERGLVVKRVGFGGDNDWVASDVRLTVSGTTFRVNGAEGGELVVPGAHQVKNALFAVANASALGVPPDVALDRLRTFRGVPGRLSVIEAGRMVVVDDTYNANPTSVRAALDWFAQLAPPASGGRKAVVLGDMLELGPGAAALHACVGEWVAALAPDLAVFVGEQSRAAFEEGTRRLGDRHRFRHVLDSESAARVVAEWIRPGDAVLVKGSRGMRMERVVRALTSGGTPHAL